MRANFVLISAMIVGITILCTLGTWQVQRLFWKEQLIERVEKRLASDAVPLETLAQTGFEKASHEYQPVSVTGTYDHSDEVYFFGTGKGGQSGWNVHTPLYLESDNVVIVNRGFVPFELKDPAKRSEGQIDGTVTVTGLLRFPLSEKPLGSLANDLQKREFYWRNVPEMSSVMGGVPNRFLPVIVDAGPQALPGGWPRGGTTILSFSNNHLQYAVTWYGLAATLIGVGGFFLWSRRRKT